LLLNLIWSLISLDEYQVSRLVIPLVVILAGISNFIQVSPPAEQLFRLKDEFVLDFEIALKPSLSRLDKDCATHSNHHVA
jgi:hypothetical protein